MKNVVEKLDSRTDYCCQLLCEYLDYQIILHNLIVWTIIQFRCVDSVEPYRVLYVEQNIIDYVIMLDNFDDRKRGVSPARRERLRMWLAHHDEDD